MAEDFLMMGDEVTWTLNHVYWWGVIVEMIFGKWWHRYQHGSRTLPLSLFLSPHRYGSAYAA